MYKEKTRKPDFLIVGAMKAGSTSLYRDLYEHPDIYLSEEKEPETLVRFGGDLDEISKDYKSLFKSAQENQLLGDASTAYAKMPTFEDVPLRAKQLCGDELKIIYIVRNPIGRIISQYKHEHAQGTESKKIDDAVFSDPKYIKYSDYVYQIKQWEEHFSHENILVLKFEDYISDKSAIHKKMCEHLNINYDPSYFPVDDEIHNSSSSKPVPTKLIKKLIIENKFYQRRFKKLFPQKFRMAVAKLIMPNTKDRYDSIKLSESAREKLTAHFKAINENGYF